MLRDIELTETQKQRLVAKSATAAQNFVEWNAALSKQERRERGQKAGARTWELHKETMLRNLRESDGRVQAGLTYRKDELPIKAKLERLYKCSFSKEQIGKRFVDFASVDMLIEHTTDPSHGVHDIVKRMADIAHDPRRKIAFLPLNHLGKKNLALLAALGVELRDCTIL